MSYKTKKFLRLSFKKSKKRYYEDLNEKSVVGNTLLGKTISKDKIHLIENNELVKTDQEIAEI